MPSLPAAGVLTYWSFSRLVSRWRNILHSSLRHCQALLDPQVLLKLKLVDALHTLVHWKVRVLQAYIIIGSRLCPGLKLMSLSPHIHSSGDESNVLAGLGTTLQNFGLWYSKIVVSLFRVGAFYGGCSGCFCCSCWW